MMLLALALSGGLAAFQPLQRPAFSKRANVQMSSRPAQFSDHAAVRLDGNHQEIFRAAVTAAIPLQLSPLSAAWA